MKLLQIGPYPPPVGGWSFHIKIFKDYLDNIGIGNLVLNMGPNRKVKSREYIDVQGAWDYVRKIIKYSRKGYLIYIHLNGDSIKGFFLVIIAQLVALFFFKRCVLSFHAGIVQVCFFKQLNTQKILAYLAFFLAKGIMCNSVEVKNKIAQFHVDFQKIFAIPCFSEQYLKHQPVMTSAEKNFIQMHNPVVCCYLFFRSEYEPDVIIDGINIIIGRYPDLGCILIGSEVGAEKYIQQIQEYGISNNFLFAGEKSHDNFLTLFENSDLTIRAHVRDGVCSSVMESLALGVPVVANDNCTRPKEVILFESKNSKDLAEKTIFAIDNNDKIRATLNSIYRRNAIKEELEFLKAM